MTPQPDREKVTLARKVKDEKGRPMRTAPWFLVPPDTDYGDAYEIRTFTPESEWDMREELWECYCASGADPDGADARHLNAGEAVRAVRELMDDYNEALDEAAEFELRELREALTLESLTEIVNQADIEFEVEGGGTRHWVRDCFLPRLEAALATTPDLAAEPPERCSTCGSPQVGANKARAVLDIDPCPDPFHSPDSDG